VRQTEVHHLHAARLGEEDVAGLQVAVEEPGAVGVGQRPGNLDAHVHDLVHRHRSARQAAGQGLALEELEHQVRSGLALAVVEDRDDVLVLEPRRRLGLLQEHRVELAGPDARAHRLEGHRTAQVPVAGLEDHAEAAAPDLLHHLEAADHHAGDEFLRRRRCARSSWLRRSRPRRSAGSLELLQERRAPLRSGEQAGQEIGQGGLRATAGSFCRARPDQLLEEGRTSVGARCIHREQTGGEAGPLGLVGAGYGGASELLEEERTAVGPRHHRRQCLDQDARSLGLGRAGSDRTGEVLEEGGASVGGAHRRLRRRACGIAACSLASCALAPGSRGPGESIEEFRPAVGGVVRSARSPLVHGRRQRTGVSRFAARPGMATLGHVDPAPVVL
jgi:hypothetical protein